MIGADGNNYLVSVDIPGIESVTLQGAHFGLGQGTAAREVREQARLTQAQMAVLMGMSVSGYRKWEQGTRRVSGPAEALLRVIAHDPNAVRRALLG